MGKGDLELIRLALFEIKKEKDDDTVADLIGNKVLNLQNPKSGYLHLISVLQRNIKKRIMGLEYEDASKKLAKSPAIDWFEDLEKKGAPCKAVVLPIEDEQQKKMLSELLNSTEDSDFRRVCGDLNNIFVKITRRPKGIIGYVQFEFQITRNVPKRFLAILITDFSLDTLIIDTLSVLKYLQNTFKHNFRTTMLYPHILKETSSNQNGVKQTEFLTTDKDSIKIHTTEEDPAVFSIVGVLPPRNPQKEIEKIYKEKSSNWRNITEIGKFSTKKDRMSSVINIKIDKVKLLVDLDTFINKYELFISKKGKGILIKNAAEIKVLLGDKNLLDEQMIKFKSLEEIFEDDNKK